MTRTRIFTIGIALLATTGCASFEPNLDSESTGLTGTSDTDAGTDGSTGAGTGGGSGGSGGETGGSTGGATDGGTGGSTGAETQGGTTGGPAANPGPGEPCDPLDAFSGIAPCEDPENPQTLYTCTTVPMEGDNETVWDFECVEVKDTNGNGYDIGDGCDDDLGAWWNDGTAAGCLNAWCLSNGLGNNPDLDEHVNWPPGECGFGSAETIYVKGCCSPYCDTEHPCDPGWTCSPLAQQGIDIDTTVGTCVWNG